MGPSSTATGTAVTGDVESAQERLWRTGIAGNYDAASPDMEAWFNDNDDNWDNTSLCQKYDTSYWTNSGAVQVIRGIGPSHWIDHDPDDPRTVLLWEFADAPEHVRKLTRVQNGKFIAEISNQILEEEKDKHPFWEMGGDFAPHAVSFTPHPHRPGFTIVMGV